ncbi:tRNA lysidine(34) synthetase TilS [Candidatus Saccharibacteria bacterium]|nr:tRNA lysidine(34) synthetase TilS [Candidatus Saccharibacteria bacterium]
MKYVVAVSGGVDSVVLLDMLVREGAHELIVAHFDHGIRPESDADARFVHALAKKYDLAFETKREELGARASEDRARERRYAFLNSIAKTHSATLVTAHHKDDMLESIAINVTRGTGWRGLAVFANPAIVRPLLDMPKSELYRYAVRHGLEWVEDETNAETIYLRNRLRRLLHTHMAQRAKNDMYTLWQQQINLRQEIDAECQKVLVGAGKSRYFFTHIDEGAALELLRGMLVENNASLTRPQRKRLLHAIKTMSAGTTFEAGSGVHVTFSKQEFIVNVG